MRYVVTGGTGFIERRVVSRLLDRFPGEEVGVLVERSAVDWGNRVKSLVGLVGDPTATELGGVDHVVHFAATVESTRSAIALARRLDATLHHVSSIAVAGTFRGDYSEADFNVGQHLPTPYHQSIFEAERMVRAEPGLRYRIYRPAVVVGDSRTGEIDKIDGLYHFFAVLAKLARLPSFTPIALPDVGRTNVVPVDYVADALVELMHAPGRDGQTFHLTSPTNIGLHDIYRGITGAAGLPALRGEMPQAVARPLMRLLLTARGTAKILRDMAATQLGIPADVLTGLDLRATPVSHETTEALRASGIAVPPFSAYAPTLWRYWAEHLDPNRTRRDHTLAGRHVIITGASSGIGRAAAIAVAGRGATVFALARNRDALDAVVAKIRAAGGQAHAFTCDVTDSAAVEHTITDILSRFGHVDYLVNNAGRSIRRSVINSTDRLHDYERTMAVNYFGAVRMVLALLPHWRERQFGHVVNVSSQGVQARNPKYSSYLPTKAALDTFADVVAAETLSDHITFTTIHMPLVNTPMIAPSRRLNPAPPISAEHAAAMVVRALVEKPARIDTPIGTVVEAGNYFAPRLFRRIMHQLYLGYPDSPAARGITAVRPLPQRPRRPAVTGIRVPRPVKRAVRTLPGVHW
ncbi:MAG TPA: SDR family oxidoreductase [Mycobacterium sp.]|nr:SDR family oxidoreductase [Mycobacterium sp.]